MALSKGMLVAQHMWVNRNMLAEALYETTILNFRRLLEKDELAGGILR